MEARAKGRSAAELLRQSKLKRSKWYELDDPPRRAVQIRRPQEGELFDMRGSRTAQDVVDLLSAAAIDWRGFTEADILGEAVGSQDAAEYSPELFAEWVFDHVDVLMNLAGRVIDDAKKHVADREAAAKNSGTS